MPTIQVNGANLFYEDSGGDDKEVIVFSHGLLMNHHMFDAQVETLKADYRCIRYDHRGQAQSETTEDGYDMDSLAEDARALIEKLTIAPCHFVGLSMGGFVGQRLAIRYPELLKSLVLLETSADPEPQENIPKYTLLNFIARWLGLGLVVRQVMPILLGKTFLNDPSRKALRETWRKHIISHDRRGITRAVKGVISRDGVYDQLDKITVPTLIMVGDEDVATVPEKSERIQAKIRGSRLVRIPGAGHSSTIEEPDFVTDAISTFLKELK